MARCPIRASCAEICAKRLPPYMVPSRFEVLELLPTLPSGKVDRKALKRIELTQPAANIEEQEEPRNETEAELLKAAKRVLPPGAIPSTPISSPTSAAIRCSPRVSSPSYARRRVSPPSRLQDVYAQRSLRALAAHLQGKAQERPARSVLRAAAACCDVFFADWRRRSPYLSFSQSSPRNGSACSSPIMLITSPDADIVEEAVALLGIYMCINIATAAVSIGGKWLVIGRTKPGRYPLWGVYYYRWWLSQRLIGLTHAKWFQVSPLMRFYLTALGAKIGDDAQISEFDAGAIDLVTIGAGASLGSKLKLSNARVEGNELIIGPINIGPDAYIGTSCVIEDNVVIGEGGALEDLTSLPSGAAHRRA